MTNTKPTLAQEIAIVKRASELEPISVRTGYSEVDKELLGIEKGNHNMAKFSMRIIKRLQEVIEVQKLALERISNANSDGYVFDADGYDGVTAAEHADKYLDRAKQLLEQ